MLEYVKQELDRIEADPAVDTRARALAALRGLGLDDFGELLLSMPNAAWPRLSALLPAMAPDEVQKSWTGNCGPDLLRQSCNFVRALGCNYVRHTGRMLDGARVLDFGCGYGRLARLMYHFTDPDALYGVDPWDESIRLCHAHGLVENFLLSDYLPETLPTGGLRFDLIYAFSVFTHLSERTAKLCMRTLREALADDGLLAVTIRPVEYWHADICARRDNTVEQMIETHRREGFAFKPHQREAVDGEVTYGDASMTFEWMRGNFPGWRIVGVDRCIEDGYQVYVFLKKT